VYTAAETPDALQWTGQLPKLPLPMGISNTI